MGEALTGIRSDIFKTSAAMETIDGRVSTMQRSFGQLSGSTKASLGNLSAQMQDVIVQVTGGTSALRALSQQAPQALSAFGPFGAIAGTVAAALLGATSAMLGFNKEVEDTPDFLGNLTSGLSSAEQRAKAYTEAIGDASAATAKLFTSVAQSQREALGDQAQPGAAALSGNLRERLLDELNSRTRSGINPQTGLPIDAVAGVKLRLQAIDQAKAAQDEIEAAVQAGNPAQLDEIINKYQLVNKETLDLIDQLRKIAGESGALQKAQAAATPSPQSIYPDRTLADEQALKGYRDDAGRDAKRAADAQAQATREAQTKAEQAAKTLATKASQDRNYIASLQQQATAAKGLADATELGTAAVRRQQIANEEANKILEAGQRLKGRDLELAEAAIRAKADEERRQLALNEAERANLALGASGGTTARAATGTGSFYDKMPGDENFERALNEYNKSLDSNADIQRDILVRPWQDLASQVSSITQNMFDELLTRGKVSMSSLADGIGNLFKTTITGTLSNVLTLPINTAVSEIAKQSLQPGQSFGSVAQQFGKDHPYLASAGLGGAGGYVAGSVYGQLTGKQDTYASTGGAVGGAAGAVAGAALGSVVPGLGTALGGVIGGALGSLGGSFLGGLFGGGKMGNDQSRQDYWTSKGKITWSDSSYSPENRAITSGLGGQLQALQESLSGLGASFDSVGIKLGAGNKSGITVNGKQYGSQEEALPAVIRLLLDATSGLSGSQQTALANTKGRTAQEVLGDVQFAKEFDKLTFAGTAFEAAMRDLNDQFDAAQHKAHELGLDEQALADARAKAVERLQIEKARQDRDLEYTIQGALAADDLQRALLAANARFDQLVDQMKDAGYGQGSIDAVNAARTRAGEQIYEADRKMRQQFDRQLVDTLNNSQLGSTLSGIGQQFDDLAARAKDLGYSSESLAAIETARVRAQQEAIKQYEQQAVDQQRQIEQQVRGVQGYFQGLIDPLKSVIANDNRLSPIGQISQARDSFRETLALAQGGDVEAIRALSSQAQTLKGLSGQYLGSGGLGGEIAAEVRRGLESVVGGLQDQERNALLSFPDVVRETTAEQIRVMIEQFDRLVDEQARTRRELENLRPAA